MSCSVIVKPQYKNMSVQQLMVEQMFMWNQPWVEREGRRWKRESRWTTSKDTSSKPSRAKNVLLGLAQARPGPAIAGLAWPGLCRPRPAKAGQLQFSLAIHWPRLAQAGPVSTGQSRPVMCWLSCSVRIKAIMTGKCHGQPEQFS